MSASVKRQVTHSWERSNLLGVRCRWWNMFLIPLHNVFFFGNVLSPSTSWTWPRALVYSSGPMLPLHLIHLFSTAPAHVCDYGRPGGSCRPATRGPTAGAAGAKLKLLPACEPPLPPPPHQIHHNRRTAAPLLLMPNHFLPRYILNAHRHKSGYSPQTAQAANELRVKVSSSWHLLFLNELKNSLARGRLPSDNPCNPNPPIISYVTRRIP